MNISKSPLRLGLTVDLGNYGTNPMERGRYIEWFADDTSGDGPAMLHVYLIDRHLHSKPGVFSDDDIRRLEDSIGEFSLFIQNFPQIELVSFQFPYNQLPPELQVVENMDVLYGSSDNNSQRKRLLEGGKLVDIAESERMVNSFLDIVSRTDFSFLGRRPIVLFHAGGILPYDLIENDSNFSNIVGLRRNLLNDQLDYHSRLLNFVDGKNVDIGWENIPIWDAVFHDPKDADKRDIQLYQWLTEHSFEDFVDRLSLGGTHTIDIPHVAMSSAYYSQRHNRFFSMEMLREEFKGVPFSLRSPSDYVRFASEFFMNGERSTLDVTYHIADCNGLFGNNEGVIVGANRSVIDWRDLVNSIRKYTPGSYGAIEVQHGHLKENYDTHIRTSLRNFLSFCD